MHEWDKLKYGGATDIHGNIIWEVTEEEHNETLAWIKRVFGESDK